MEVALINLLLICSTLLILRASSMKLEYERAVAFKFDRKYVHKPRFWVGHYNRTEKALNADFALRCPFKDDAKIAFDYMKYMSNEYRDFGIQFGVKVKDMLFKNDTVKMFSAYSSDLFKSLVDPPAVWPLQVNVTYRLRNLNSAQTYLPLFPEGRYLCIADIFHDDGQTLMVKMGIYIKITYPIAY